MVFLCGLNLNAQSINEDPPKRWKASQLYLGFGGNNDHFNRMSLDHILAVAKSPESVRQETNGWTETVDAITYGSSISAGISLNPFDYASGEYRRGRELRLGLGLAGAREAMVSYDEEATGATRSLIFCSVVTELNLEAEYLYKGQWGRRITWYAGYGLSGGSSISSEVLVFDNITPAVDTTNPEEIVPIESNMESFSGKHVSYGRIYAPYGVHYRIGNRYHLGLDFRTGIGMQAIQNEHPDFIKKSGSFMFGMRLDL